MADLHPDLLKILACPKCRGEVELRPAGDEIVCAACSLAFPIRGGIPVMLVDEAAPLPAERP